MLEKLELERRRLEPEPHSSEDEDLDAEDDDDDEVGSLGRLPARQRKSPKKKKRSVSFNE